MSGVNLACCCTAGGAPCVNCSGSAPLEYSVTISGNALCTGCHTENAGYSRRYELLSGSLNYSGIKITQGLYPGRGSCGWANLDTGTKLRLRQYSVAACSGFEMPIEFLNWGVLGLRISQPSAGLWVVRLHSAVDKFQGGTGLEAAQICFVGELEFTSKPTCKQTFVFSNTQTACEPAGNQGSGGSAVVSPV